MNSTNFIKDQKRSKHAFLKAMKFCSGELIVTLENLSIYVSLYVAAIFVNKYVLSVLNFTYPTIFQGWQSLVGAILLRLLISMGKINIEVSQISRSRITPWLPAMMLHVLSIYSGSVALSKISVPVFICLHNLTLVLTGIVEIFAYKRYCLDLRSTMLFILLSSSLFIAATDPQFDANAYYWMGGHILSTACISIYQFLNRSQLQLGDLEKVYLNYLYSFAVLLPCTYFLGDAIQVQHFQFWYYYKFYISCFFSGVFGVLLILFQHSVNSSSQASGPKMNPADMAGVAKVVASGLSLAVFSFKSSMLNIPWILVNLCAGMLLKSTDFDLSQHSHHEAQSSSAVDSSSNSDSPVDVWLPLTEKASVISL